MATANPLAGEQPTLPCVGNHNLFFPAPRERQGTERETRQYLATRYCATCPAKAACLTEGMAQEYRYGIWGGQDLTQY